MVLPIVPECASLYLTSMSASDIRQDFSPTAAAPGSISAAGVPRYILYGESGSRSDWFVNVEHLDARCRERGWVIAPHTHPRFTQVVVCTAGGGEMIVEGETQRFARDSVMMVPSHCIHGFHYADGTQGWVLTVENNYLADLLARAPALKALFTGAGVVHLADTAVPGMEAAFAALADELEGRRDGCAIGAEIHLLSILLTLLRHWPAWPAAVAAGGSRQALVARFKVIVEERYRSQPSVGDIARELSVSVSQLRLACHHVAGLSPVGIVHDRLATEAKRCLAFTPMTIAEIADWLGFSDAAYFSRFFGRMTGKTPTAYRRSREFG